MDLGYFADWNNEGAVILGVTRPELPSFIANIKEFFASTELMLDVHALPSVNQHKGIRLSLVRPGVTLKDRFCWVCPGEHSENEIIEMLSGKESGDRPGHHYFELLPNPIDLIVAFDEYDSSLWIECHSPAAVLDLANAT